MGQYLTNSPVERFARYIEMAAVARRSAASAKTKEARDIYRRVIQEFPDSPFAREASQKANPANG